MRILIGMVVVALAGCGDKKTAAPPPPPPPAQVDEAKRAQLQAEELARQAADDARQMKAKLDALAADLDKLGAQTTAAVDAVVAAQSEADRAAAKAKLEELRAEKAAMEQRVTELKASAARMERAKGVHISDECLANPLAKGC